MLTRVAAIDLAQAPQMEPVRRDLLDRPLQSYRSFQHEQRSDPASGHEAGEACRRMGQISAQRGQTPRAEHGCGDAIRLLAKLVAEFPSEAKHRTALAYANH